LPDLWITGIRKGKIRAIWVIKKIRVIRVIQRIPVKTIEEKV